MRMSATLRRRLAILPAIGAVVASALVVEAQTGGYQVVAGWMKLPSGFILGTPQPAPTMEEMAATRAAGGVVGAISAYAGVAVDDQDRVYVFHRGQEDLKERYPKDLRTRQHPLAVFDASGKFIQWAGDGVKDGFLGPHFIDVDAEGSVWVIERDNHRITKLNKDLNTVAMQLGTAGVSGADATHFNLPTDIAWSKNGDIFITDGYGNNRVIKYTKDGKFIKQWGGGPETKTDKDGGFNLPHGISIDSQDRLYVLDRENARVQIFDTEGKFLGKWTDIGYSWGIGTMRGGKDPYAYLSNVRAGVVAKVSMADGKVIARFGGGVGRNPGQMDGAHDVAVDSKGAVYIADTWGQRVQKFVNGQVVATLGGRGVGDQRAWLPAPVAPLLRAPGQMVADE